MDVNGTRFHLVLGEGDWLPHTASGAAPADVEWSGGATAPAPAPARVPARRDSVMLTAEGRRGAARDRYGNWYWISDDEHEVR